MEARHRNEGLTPGENYQGKELIKERRSSRKGGHQGTEFIRKEYFLIVVVSSYILLVLLPRHLSRPGLTLVHPNIPAMRLKLGTDKRHNAYEM